MGLCIVPGIYAGGVGLCARCRFFCVLFAARRPVHRAAGRPEEGGFVEKSCPRWLCWPRNVVIYVILARALCGHSPSPSSSICPTRSAMPTGCWRRGDAAEALNWYKQAGEALLHYKKTLFGKWVRR